MVLSGLAFWTIVLSQFFAAALAGLVFARLAEAGA